MSYSVNSKEFGGFYDGDTYLRFRRNALPSEGIDWFCDMCGEKVVMVNRRFQNSAVADALAAVYQKQATSRTFAMLKEHGLNAHDIVGLFTNLGIPVQEWYLAIAFFRHYPELPEAEAGDRCPWRYFDDTGNCLLYTSPSPRD